MTDHFEARVVQVLQSISDALREVQEGLPWPASDHVWHKLEVIREGLESINVHAMEREHDDDDHR